MSQQHLRREVTGRLALLCRKTSFLDCPAKVLHCTLLLSAELFRQVPDEARNWCWSCVSLPALQEGTSGGCRADPRHYCETSKENNG